MEEEELKLILELVTAVKELQAKLAGKYKEPVKKEHLELIEKTLNFIYGDM